jgi:deoxyhypusine synthase
MGDAVKDATGGAAAHVFVKGDAAGVQQLLDAPVAVGGYRIPDSGRVDYEALLASYNTVGFQATHFGRAVDVVRRMLRWSLADEPVADDEDDELRSEEARRRVRCTVFLGYTSNMISCGVRESIHFLVKHRLVDAIVTTAGGIEEDFIKCIAPTYVGDFYLDGHELRRRGLNRIGNLLIPNDNYCKFEDWLTPLLDEMLEEQRSKGTVWSPSLIIRRLGQAIHHEDSVYYWAYKNDIPVYCPAITDGSLGDMIYFHSFKNPGLVIDIASDLRRINMQAVRARKSGMVILGGGVIKHHICNANLMRNGADYTVFVNTGQEFDGSDTGARPDEAISWGKIRMGSAAVKVYADASLVFPLLVAQAFAPAVAERAAAAAAATAAAAE